MNLFEKKDPVVIVGMGEMGELLATGFLKMGYTVLPVLRNTDWPSLIFRAPTPELVLIAVGETALDEVLANLPAPWRRVTALLQNEILPCHYARHALTDPSIITVWFDKKKGRPCVSVLPSVISGPKACLIEAALHQVEVPSRVIPESCRLFEMIRKNLYILTINIAGMVVGGTVGELRSLHTALMKAVADDILALQSAMVGEPLPVEALMEAMLEGFDGDPDHICMGRSAPERLRRSLHLARGLGIETPCLDQIATKYLDRA